MEADSKASYAKKISLLLLIPIVIIIVHLTQNKELVIAIALITLSLKKMLFQSLPRKIDLNQVENYLRSLTTVDQIVSIELYYVTPKIKFLYVNLKMTSVDILTWDSLKRRIKSNLCQKFGLTETFIQMTSAINHQIRHANKESNIDTIELEFQRYLNLRRQASIDLN